MSWLSSAIGGLGIFGSGSKAESMSVLSPEQREMLQTIFSQHLGPGLEAGATPSQYPAYTPTAPLLEQAFSQAGSLAGYGQGTIIDALTKQASGIPAYSFDPAATTKRFEETFASPMMASWRENVMPVVQESYNVPGMAHSTLAGRGVSDAANRFYGESVAPRLFDSLQADWTMGIQSGEAAAGRQLSGALALGQLPALAGSGAAQMGTLQQQEQDRILAALRGEEMRMMPEYSPWLQMALQGATAQTMETVGFEGQQGILGQGLGLASGLGIGRLFGIV